MYKILQIVSILLIAVGMALSLAHALELPGKLRLGKETYLAVQPIYYPGFTVGGVFGEAGAMLATLALLVFTPFASAAFWLTLPALAALLIMHGVYWAITHPVNNFWLKDQHLRGVGAAFFAVDSRTGSCWLDQDWTALRNRWEYSHVARAVLATLSLIMVATAGTIARREFLKSALIGFSFAADPPGRNQETSYLGRCGRGVERSHSFMMREAVPRPIRRR